MNYKFLSIKKLHNEIKIKNNSVLIITSKFHSKKDYMLKLVEKIKRTKTVNFYGDVSSGAPIENIDYIINKFKKPDLIIGIGGGSVMDIAKACSCLFDKTRKKKFTNIKIEKKIKTILIPTILGSGAENSRGAILKNKNNNKIAIRHDLIKADFIYVDLNLVKSAKRKIKCEALYDCFSHAIETYISKYSNKIVKKRSLNAINFLLTIKSKSFFNSKINLKKLALYSILMGQNLAESTTCLPHRIQYSLAQFTNATHAQGINALHKGWLLCVLNSKVFKKLGDDLKINNNKLYQKIINLRKKLQINYSLTDFGIKKKHFIKISNKTVGKLDADPIYINKKTIFKILNSSL